jgi:hypothetical protein
MFPKFQHLLKSLKNTFLCKIYKFNGKLDYPQNILPSPTYKKILDFDNVLQFHNVFLLRRAEVSFEEAFFKLGDSYILKDDAIDYRRIPNLSTNLLGGGFKPNHSIFRVTRDTLAEKKWDGANVYLSEHLNSYTKVEGGCVVYLKANNIHNVDFPYNLDSNPVFHKEIEKFKNIFNDKIEENILGQKIKLLGSTKIVHDPINLNYWHVELKLMDYSGSELKNANSKKHEQIAKHAKDNLIKMNSLNSVDKIAEIPLHLYKAI